MKPTSEHPPCLVILAGPNGAGKSTSAPKLLRDYVEMSAFLNADAVARGFSDWKPEKFAFSAGKVILSQVEEFLDQRESFAIETTLAAKTYARLAKRASSYGYRTTVFYLWVADPLLSVNRVAGRVADGGHHIPTDVILRRYDSGLRNFFRVYRSCVDQWVLFNNSDPTNPLIKIAESIDGQTLIHDHPLYSRLEGTYAHD